MAEIKAAEISAILKEQLAHFDANASLEEVGTVLQVGDGIARIFGLSNAQYGELVKFDNGLKGIVLNLEEDNVGITLLGPSTDIKEGDIFYVYNDYYKKYFFGKILVDISGRLTKHVAKNSVLNFFSDCYLVAVYKEISDTPELNSREFIIPGCFIYKTSFNRRNRNGFDWTHYAYEAVDYHALEFPEFFLSNDDGVSLVPLTKFGMPTPTTKISAAATSSARFCVALWQMVTVARDSSNSNACGRPTILDAPTTTAFLPFGSMP